MNTIKKHLFIHSFRHLCINVARHQEKRCEQELAVSKRNYNTFGVHSITQTSLPTIYDHHPTWRYLFKLIKLTLYLSLNKYVINKFTIPVIRIYNNLN